MLLTEHNKILKFYEVTFIYWNSWLAEILHINRKTTNLVVNLTNINS